MYTREEYEKQINDSPAFTVDREASPELYKTEKRRLLNLITDYYMKYIYPGKALETYSVTLMETASECIKNYDAQKGVFLHLLNSSMKRELYKAKAKEAISAKRQGLKLSKEEDRQIRCILNYAQSKGLDLSDPAEQEKISMAMGIGTDRVRELLKINDDATAVQSTVRGDDGDEIELFDLQASTYKTAEEKIIETDAFNERADKINEVFLSLQDRQKRLISMRLTTDILKQFSLDTEAVAEMLKGRDFLSEEILSHFRKTGKAPTAKEIGELCGVSEQSLSRSYKNFTEKLRKVLSP